MCHMTVDICSYVDSSSAYVEVVELFPKTALNIDFALPEAG